MIGGKCWWLCLPNIFLTEIVQYLPGTVNPQPSAVTSNSLSESHKPPQKVHHTVEDHCIYGDVDDILAPNLFVFCSDFYGQYFEASPDTWKRTRLFRTSAVASFLALNWVSKHLIHTRAAIAVHLRFLAMGLETDPAATLQKSMFLQSEQS